MNRLIAIFLYVILLTSTQSSAQMLDIKKIINNTKMLEKTLAVKGSLDSKKLIYNEIRAGEKVVYCNQSSNKTLYGGHLCDDRLETLLHPSKDLRESAKSVAVFVRKNKIVKKGNGYQFKGLNTLGDAYDPLCTEDPYEEPFGKQIIPGFCTGFLVEENVLATAAHCLSSINKGAYVVFEFWLKGGESEANIKSENFYEVKKVKDFVFNPGAEDWALVELTKSVVGREPLKVRKSGKVANEVDVCVIGHPMGLPQKIACGAIVASNEEHSYFKSNLDTYGGNSGSPVFNEKSNIVEGILVRGHQDFKKYGSCYASVICESIEECDGETVTRTTLWSKLIASSPPEQVALAEGCEEGRIYTQRGCTGGYFEDGVYHQPN